MSSSSSSSAVHVEDVAQGMSIWLIFDLDCLIFGSDLTLFLAMYCVWLNIHKRRSVEGISYDAYFQTPSIAAMCTQKISTGSRRWWL